MKTRTEEEFRQIENDRDYWRRKCDALVAFFRRLDWRIEDWESISPGVSEIFLKGATWATWAK